MQQRYRLILFFSLLFTVSFKTIFGQLTPQNELGFRNDNDVYLMINQDQYYTNGIYFYYKRTIDSLKYSRKWENKIWSIGIGHKIYNAKNGSIDSPTEVDRTITGYLYANGEINWYTKKEEVFSLGTELAFIGAKAHGENIQKGFHHIFGFYDINGWEYQLNNAFGIDARAHYDRLLFRNKKKKMDILMNGNLSLGLNHTRLSLSPTFRLGRINALFESAATGSRIQSKNYKPQKELYVFYRPQINWVIYNSTIQGGLLIDNKGPVKFDVRPWVFSQLIGFQYANEHIGMNLNYIFNTKEVISEASAHQYGSLSFIYYF